MQPQDTVPKEKTFSIVFPPDAASLPVLYSNAINVLTGANEFFITLGTATPPVVKSIKDLEALDRITAQPLLRIAVSPQTMKQFIEVLTQQYEQYQRLVEAQADNSSIQEGNADD